MDCDTINHTCLLGYESFKETVNTATFLDYVANIIINTDNVTYLALNTNTKTHLETDALTYTKCVTVINNFTYWTIPGIY